MTLGVRVSVASFTSSTVLLSPSGLSGLWLWGVPLACMILSVLRASSRPIFGALFRCSGPIPSPFGLVGIALTDSAAVGSVPFFLLSVGRLQQASAGDTWCLAVVPFRHIYHWTFAVPFNLSVSEWLCGFGL